MLPLHIGIDDTDSITAGCTTYITARLLEKLNSWPYLDYPNLVRLNPNVPWKTRGNAALAIRICIDEDQIRWVMEDVIATVEDLSQIHCPRTDPGIVFLMGAIPQEIKVFARQTIQNIVRKKEALDLIRHFNCEAIGFNSGRGLIGALAAIGNTLENDHTFELIAYRNKDNIGKPRMVDTDSIFTMDTKMAGLTFNNVDYEKRRVLVLPRGPDPVLLGIRGESVTAVKAAYHLINVREEVERWVIFRTNQGTDAHLQNVEKIARIKPYQPIIVQGSIVVNPHYIPGKHLIFSIEDESGQIDCAAYEPTGKFRKIVEKLIQDDQIEVYGGVRPKSKRNPITINVEKIKILTLASKISYRNPVCSICGKHLKSMGWRKGFRCERCGFKSLDAEKIPHELSRNLQEGLYIPSSRANRHLTKPFSRYGKEKIAIAFNPTEEFWGLNSPQFQ